MERFEFDDTEEAETTPIEELERLIEIGEEVLDEIPVVGGDIMRLAIKFIKRSGVPEFDQERLLRIVDEAFESYE